MNPTLPADYLEQMKGDDPEAYRSEVLGEFRAGVATFFDFESIAACVVEGRRELGPVDGVRYVAFVDPSGGSGRDTFTLAIAHAQGDRIVIEARGLRRSIRRVSLRKLRRFWQATAAVTYWGTAMRANGPERLFARMACATKSPS
jgi:hypothetical protein